MFGDDCRRGHLSGLRKLNAVRRGQLVSWDRSRAVHTVSPIHAIGAIRAIRAIGLCLLMSAAACSDDPVDQTSTDTSADVENDSGGSDSSADSDRTDDADESDVEAPERSSEAEVSQMRADCTFTTGALPYETVGEEFPVGDDLPFERLVILMQENRSFDHYFGAMPTVDGITDDTSNPDADGDPVLAFHETEYCINDVRHSWNSSHIQYNDGANDGFVVTNDPNGARAMGYYDDSDIPFYWDLYGTFAMSDHHFCSLLGPTWVNRYFFVAGHSFGLTSNGPVPPDRLLTDRPNTIYEQLNDAEIEWRVYFEEASFILGGFTGLALDNSQRLRTMDRFFDDLAAGDMPPVVWIDPSFFGGIDRTDEHPPGDMQFGQRWVADIVNAVMDSDLWDETAIVLTYDEHGGYFDHVPPPEACNPGLIEPDLSETSYPADFDRLGFRVPLVVVSPWSRPGYVSDRVTDLTSVLRLIQARHGLGALTPRDANAWPLLDMFDYESVPFATAPTLADAVIDDAKLARCRELFP